MNWDDSGGDGGAGDRLPAGGAAVTPMERFEDWLDTLPIFISLPLLLLLLMLGLLPVVGLAALVVVVATGGAGELVRYATVFGIGLGAGLLVRR